MKIKTNVLVVGFPKSGTVWLTMMIASILEKRCLTKEQTEKITQEVDNILRKFTKTHRTDIQDLEYRKAIYIIRDPRAVINSATHYWKRNQKNTKDLNKILKNMHYRKFIILEGILRQLKIFDNSLVDKMLRKFNLKKHHVLNWDTHIRQWEIAEKVLIVKYEDLLKTPFDEMSKICKWLELDINNNRLKKYIEYYKFKNVKKREKSTNHFRKGNSNSWKDELNHDLRKEIEERYKNFMIKYGYESANLKNG